jgi:hypothetical protein
MMPAKFGRSPLLPILLLLAASHFSAAKTAKPLGSPLTRRVGKLLYVQVKVNGAGPYWFAVDSGAHSPVIDPTVAREARVITTTTTKVGGTGKGDVSAQETAPISIDLGGLDFRFDHALVIDLSNADVPKWTRGLVGEPFFRGYVVEFDPDKPAMRFFSETGYQPPANTVKIPLADENHRLFIAAKLEVEGHGTVEHKLRVDTGSEDSVDDSFVRNSPETRSTVLGHGLGANYQSVSGVFKAVQLGPFTFEHVWGPAADLSAIGMEIFRRFTYAFDVDHGALYLAPNSHLKEPVPAPPQ